MGICKLFFWPTRFVLGVFFILYGIYGLNQQNATKDIALPHLAVIENAVNHEGVNQYFKIIRDYITQIIQYENIVLIYGGILMLFGFSLRKICIATPLIIEMFFVASPRVFKDDFGYCSALAYISLIGVALSI